MKLTLKQIENEDKFKLELHGERAEMDGAERMLAILPLPFHEEIFSGARGIPPSELPGFLTKAHDACKSVGFTCSDPKVNIDDDVDTKSISFNIDQVSLQNLLGYLGSHNSREMVKDDEHSIVKSAESQLQEQMKALSIPTDGCRELFMKTYSAAEQQLHQAGEEKSTADDVGQRMQH
jgi:hypothetical protein